MTFGCQAAAQARPPRQQRSFFVQKRNRFAGLRFCIPDLRVNPQCSTHTKKRAILTDGSFLWCMDPAANLWFDRPVILRASAAAGAIPPVLASGQSNDRGGTEAAKPPEYSRTLLFKICLPQRTFRQASQGLMTFSARSSVSTMSYIFVTLPTFSLSVRP